MNDKNGHIHVKAGNCAVTHLRHLGKFKVMLHDRDVEVEFASHLRSEQRFHRVQIKQTVTVKKVNAFSFSILHVHEYGISWFKLLWQL